MALFNRSHLFGLLLLVSLPLDGAAALALASVQDVPASRSIEERLSRSVRVRWERRRAQQVLPTTPSPTCS
jgi:hypothetical protein